MIDQSYTQEENTILKDEDHCIQQLQQGILFIIQKQDKLSLQVFNSIFDCLDSKSESWFIKLYNEEFVNIITEKVKTIILNRNQVEQYLKGLTSFCEKPLSIEDIVMYVGTYCQNESFVEYCQNHPDINKIFTNVVLDLLKKIVATKDQSWRNKQYFVKMKVLYKFMPFSTRSALACTLYRQSNQNIHADINNDITIETIIEILLLVNDFKIVNENYKTLSNLLNHSLLNLRVL
jgi:hypothetical protein